MAYRRYKGRCRGFASRQQLRRNSRLIIEFIQWFVYQVRPDGWMLDADPAIVYRLTVAAARGLTRQREYELAPQITEDLEGNISIVIRKKRRI